jgi:hypothetical protein
MYYIIHSYKQENDHICWKEKSLKQRRSISN